MFEKIEIKPASMDPQTLKLEMNKVADAYANIEIHDLSVDYIIYNDDDEVIQKMLDLFCKRYSEYITEGEIWNAKIHKCKELPKEVIYILSEGENVQDFIRKLVQLQ